MRLCAKMRCGGSAEATVALRYGEREVRIRDLLPRRDPNLLELCTRHADRLVAPVGWRRLDERGVETARESHLPEGLFA